MSVDNSRIVMFLNYLVTMRYLEDKIPNALALKTAISNIETCGFKITSGDQASIIPRVGPRTKRYIDGILNNTDSHKSGIHEIDVLPYEQQVRIVTITEMDKIPDIGIKRAAQYYDNGYNTVDKLKDLLRINGTQRTQAALRHEGEIERKIPRSKIDLFIGNFRSAINAFNNSTGSALNFDYGGSYSRGSNDSGDIDILIWSFAPREVSSKQPHFLEYLRQSRILLDTQVSGSVVYQGIAYIDQEYPSVRIDIKALHSMVDYHYAKLHLIGPGSFNTKMSDIAKSKGWTLGSNGMIVTSTKDPIVVRSEEDIFSLLGVPYLEPKDRH